MAESLNRTFYGIETKMIQEVILGTRLNRTFYGIETQVRRILYHHHPRLNRTFYGIETLTRVATIRPRWGS